jgi:hypothetical protein
MKIVNKLIKKINFKKNDLLYSVMPPGGGGGSFSPTQPIKTKKWKKNEGGDENLPFSTNAQGETGELSQVLFCFFFFFFCQCGEGGKWKTLILFEYM